MRSMLWVPVLILWLCSCSAARGQSAAVEEYTLDNGMTFLLMPRENEPASVSACWLAKVGSSCEQPGLTGINHFVSQMLFRDGFARAYTELGGTGMRSMASEDLTLCFMNLPNDRIEAWANIESDRLLNPAFDDLEGQREFLLGKRERAIGASPADLLDEQLESMLWQFTSYAWPVIGWPEDIRSYTTHDVEAFFDSYYRAENLAGVLAGDFDPEQVKPMLAVTFGRLEYCGSNAPAVRTFGVPQVAEKRMVGEITDPARVEIHFCTVPFGHPDSYALELLAAILDGPSGRLHDSLIAGQGRASGTTAYQDSRKYAGAFTILAAVHGQETAEGLEQACYEVLSLVQNELVTDVELQTIKDRIAADADTSARSNQDVLIQHAFCEALVGWTHLQTRTEHLLAVTAEDVQRVAVQYLKPERRTVAIYRHSPDVQTLDPEVAAMNERDRRMVLATMDRLMVWDENELRAALQAIAQQGESAPADSRPVLDYIVRKLRERLAEIESDGP